MVRVSRKQAFGPAEEDILFHNREFIDEVLLAPRALSRESIARTSREILSLMFGDEPGQLLQSAADELAREQTKLPENKRSIISG